MSKKTISKFTVVVVLTLAMVFGSGVVTQVLGISTTPSVQACGGVGNGGGC